MKYRILIAAMFISLFWHLFWLSAVKIVTVPGTAQPVKFSKVSFLGPILERGAIELGLKPKDRSFLEKRYPELMIQMLGLDPSRQIGDHDMEYGNLDGDRSPIDDELAGFISEAIRGDKLEPEYDAQFEKW